MKRYNNLFEKAFSIDNLYKSYENAKRSKRNKMSVQRFERNLGKNIYELKKELDDGTYKPKDYYRFIIKEPKERLVEAPSFRDCIVQHAIYSVIYEIFDKTFISTSYACRRGYGAHKASYKVQNYMRNCSDYYYIEMDIRKYFPSINHNILTNLLNKKIKDKRLLNVMIMFFSDGDKGLPIGNLLSQIYANIYLNHLDNYIKRELKVKYYSRYMDNFCCIGFNKKECNELKNKIEQFLLNELDLTFSKVSIQYIKNGFNFVGYRTWRNKRLVRKRSLYLFSKRLKQNDIIKLTSILGHAKNTQTFYFYINILRDKKILHLFSIKIHKGDIEYEIT